MKTVSYDSPYYGEVQCPVQLALSAAAQLSNGSRIGLASQVQADPSDGKEGNSMRSNQPSATPTPWSLVDPEAAILSHAFDAPRDRQWFLDHPHESSFVRTPSHLELLAWAMPPGGVVRPVRLPDGTQFREFVVGPEPRYLAD